MTKEKLALKKLEEKINKLRKEVRDNSWWKYRHTHSGIELALILLAIGLFLVFIFSPYFSFYTPTYMKQFSEAVEISLPETGDWEKICVGWEEIIFENKWYKYTVYCDNEIWDRTSWSNVYDLMVEEAIKTKNYCLQWTDNIKIEWEMEIRDIYSEKGDCAATILCQGSKCDEIRELLKPKEPCECECEQCEFKPPEIHWEELNLSPQWDCGSFCWENWEELNITWVKLPSHFMYFREMLE